MRIVGQKRDKADEDGKIAGKVRNGQRAPGRPRKRASAPDRARGFAADNVAIVVNDLGRSYPGASRRTSTEATGARSALVRWAEDGSRMASRLAGALLGSSFRMGARLHHRCHGAKPLAVDGKAARSPIQTAGPALSRLCLKRAAADGASAD